MVLRKLMACMVLAVMVCGPAWASWDEGTQGDMDSGTDTMSTYGTYTYEGTASRSPSLFDTTDFLTINVTPTDAFVSAVTISVDYTDIGTAEYEAVLRNRVGGNTVGQITLLLEQNSGVYNVSYDETDLAAFNAQPIGDLLLTAGFIRNSVDGTSGDYNITIELEQVVPEPASLALLGLGSLGLLARRRR